MKPKKRIRTNNPNPLPAQTSSTTPSVSGSAAECDTTSRLPGRRPILENEANHGEAGSWYGSWPRVPKSTPSTKLATESILAGTSKPSPSPDFSRYDTKKNVDSAEAATPALQGTPANKGSALDEPQLDLGDERHAESTEDKPISDAQVLPQTTRASGWAGWFNKIPPVDATSTSPGVAMVESSQNVSEAAVAPAPLSEPPPREPEKAAPSTFWLPFWQTASSAAVGAAVVTDSASARIDNVQVAPPGEGNLQGVASQAPLEATSAGSTWAFWSRDARSAASPKPSDLSGPGELAVMGQASEIRPEPASGAEIPAASSIHAGQPTRPPPFRASLSRNKRLRPPSMDLDERRESPKPPQTGSGEANADFTVSGETALSNSGSKNLLLPSFRGTYRMAESPSMLRQIARLLLRMEQPPSEQVFLTKNMPKIRRAVAIGVHGLFPAAYLRPMIGQPTGTSIKFANHAAEGVRRWTDGHGSRDCEIEKIALEGEGRIADRVENLWKLLLNWTEQVRAADLIVVACHSQGVPVAIMLLAKLIELRIVSTSRVGVCAMAGVSLGPFTDYKSGLGMLMGSAAELWQFANAASEVSKSYEQALQVVLDYGVRVTYIGSIDDQVVPLESALYSPAHHPYLYRAVFIDGRVHAPDFIAHLVGFACKLRNLGVSDHGLMRELSIPLAGSLYSGEGHSRVYDDPQVYDLAVSHALETTSVGKVPCVIQQQQGLSDANPFFLPFVMRGLLEEDFVKTELSAETSELLKQFDDWKPVTKALKDVKYRLEALRSRL